MPTLGAYLLRCLSLSLLSRRRLLSAAAVLTRVANARLRRRAFLSERAALAAQLCASTLCTRARGGRRYSLLRP